MSAANRAEIRRLRDVVIDVINRLRREVDDMRSDNERQADARLCEGQVSAQVSTLEVRLAQVEARLAMVEARPVQVPNWNPVFTGHFGYQCPLCYGWVPAGSTHSCAGHT